MPPRKCWWSFEIQRQNPAQVATDIVETVLSGQRQIADSEEVEDEEKKHYRCVSDAMVGISSLKRRAAELETDFPAKKSKLHDESESPLANATIGSALIAGVAAVGTLFAGALAVFVVSLQFSLCFGNYWPLSAENLTLSWRMQQRWKRN